MNALFGLMPTQLYNLCDDGLHSLTPINVDREQVDAVLNEGDNLYRIAFLPSVLAWVALDYADDVCNQAAAMKLNFARECREIRLLTKSYRSRYNKHEMNDANEENGIGIQEQFSKDLSELREQLSEHIRYMKPQQSEEMRIFYVSVYMAIFAFRAMLNYVFECDKYLDKRIKSFGNGSIMLSQTRIIYRILPAFLGKDKDLIRPRDLDDYAMRLIEFIKSSEFVNEKRPKNL